MYIYIYTHISNIRDTFILLEMQVIGGNLMMRDRTANKVIDGPARIAPNRKWFGNTRTIGAEQLDKFRTAVAEQVCCWQTRACCRSHGHIADAFERYLPRFNRI